jgi:putative peptidoglycan binding protein
VSAGCKLRARVAGLAVAAALALLALAPGSAAADAPVDGNGMWIWYVSAAGGSADAIAAKAAQYHIRTVYIKAADAGNYWTQFSPELVTALHAHGLQVCAWQFVYGSSPVAEAQRGAQAVANGADCLVIDAESSYEGRYTSAEHYIDELRSLVGPDFPLALSSFPFVDYHPAFPYSVFLAPGAAQYNLPQLYWHTIGTSVKKGYSHTFRFNRPYDAPIDPLGQTYDDPPKKDLVRFRQFANEYGAGGVSWWSWQHTSTPEWRRISKQLTTGVPDFDAKIRYPVLHRGAAGDLVVLAQEYLRAYEIAVEIDGTFDSGMEGAVREFQTKQGLAASGVLDGPTWSKLAERDPVKARWTGPGRSGPSQPDSAALAALEPELPFTAGIP